jgi:hypothetical protein
MIKCCRLQPLLLKMRERERERERERDTDRQREELNNSPEQRL